MRTRGVLVEFLYKTLETHGFPNVMMPTTPSLFSHREL